MTKRDSSIDLFKGVLTLFMIITHILQIFSSNKIFDDITFYVNLTTFSGFMFIFGYTTYNAYISRNIDRTVF